MYVVINLVNKLLFLKREEKLLNIEGRNIIECDSLGKVYELEGEANVTALRNITLKGDSREGAIKRGEFAIIRGPSGGGKTTFLNLIGTIDKSTNGTLCIIFLMQGSTAKKYSNRTTTPK